MNFFDITQQPIKIYGLAIKDSEKGRFWRLPPEMIEKMPQYEFLGKRTVGGRVRFCTNSENITIKMTLAQSKEDKTIPLVGSAGADVYLGKGKDSKYLGYISPEKHGLEETKAEKTFQKTKSMEIVTVNLPRNDHLISMKIGIDDEATIKEAPEYTISSPIVFYGSSITEGGCCARVGNAYTSVVSRWLDADYYNYGFSGSARGEKVFAEYVASICDMSAFVYDYDYNAFTAEELEATHESFFKIVREKHPMLPILIMSKPDADNDRVLVEKRKQVIYKTYWNAINAGDDKVWFLDGGKFFGDTGRAECTVDGVHPNALGFMRMAESVYPVLRKILK